MKRGEMEIRGRVPRNATDEIVIQYGRDKWDNEVIDIRWNLNEKLSRKGIRMNMQEAEHIYNLLGRILDGKSERDREQD
jgi:hypothetical protein